MVIESGVRIVGVAGDAVLLLDLVVVRGDGDLRRAGAAARLNASANARDDDVPHGFPPGLARLIGALAVEEA